MDFTLKQAQALVEAFGGDEESNMTVVEVKDGQASHSGPGLYVHCTDYPEEGSTFLGNDSSQLPEVDLKSESKSLVGSMTAEEKYAAWHFYTAVADDQVPFCVDKKMRSRLRELGLMKWVGGNIFETTELLAEIYPTLDRMVRF